jgi:hypothetical protein
MSTIKADNFTWKSGESSGQAQHTVTADKVVLGTAKVWCNYNGVTPGIRSSFNTSSVTRNSTAIYTFTYSTSMSDANYALSGSAQLATAGQSQHLHFGPYATGSLLAGSVVAITPYNSGGASGDTFYVDAIYCLMSVNR